MPFFWPLQVKYSCNDAHQKPSKHDINREPVWNLTHLKADPTSSFASLALLHHSWNKNLKHWTTVVHKGENELSNTKCNRLHFFIKWNSGHFSMTHRMHDKQIQWIANSLNISWVFPNYKISPCFLIGEFSKFSLIFVIFRHLSNYMAKPSKSIFSHF